MKREWQIDYYWDKDKFKSFEQKIEEHKKLVEVKKKLKKKLGKKNEKNME